MHEAFAVCQHEVEKSMTAAARGPVKNVGIKCESTYYLTEQSVYPKRI